MKWSSIIALGWVLALIIPAGVAAAEAENNAVNTSSGPVFVLSSPAVKDGGQLPVEYTGDGESSTLPLEWTGAPAGTKSFALIMHHIAPDKTKWYWIIYNIPAKVKILPKNVKNVGKLGNNSVNGRVEYAPPHSKGPGPKKYIYTIYALSAAPKIKVKPAEVNREVLLSAMEGLVLGKAEMSVIYERFISSEDGESRSGPDNGRGEPPPPPPGDGR